MDAHKSQDAPEGFYLVRWTGEPYTLQERTVVHGVGELDAGYLVCEGYYYDRIAQATRWYEPPDFSPSNPPDKKLFWVQHVLEGDLEVKHAQPSGTFVPAHNLISHHNRRQKWKVVRVLLDQMERLQAAKNRREAWDMVVFEEEEFEEAEEEEEEQVKDELEDNEEELE